MHGPVPITCIKPGPLGPLGLPGPSPTLCNLCQAPCRLGSYDVFPNQADPLQPRGCEGYAPACGRPEGRMGLELVTVMDITPYRLLSCISALLVITFFIESVVAGMQRQLLNTNPISPHKALPGCKPNALGICTPGVSMTDLVLSDTWCTRAVQPYRHPGSKIVLLDPVGNVCDGDLQSMTELDTVQLFSLTL